MKNSANLMEYKLFIYNIPPKGWLLLKPILYSLGYDHNNLTPFGRKYPDVLFNKAHQICCGDNRPGSEIYLKNSIFKGSCLGAIEEYSFEEFLEKHGKKLAGVLYGD